MRSRALPFGTVGGLIPRTSKPDFCNAAAIRMVSPSSPIMTGRICELPWTRNLSCAKLMSVCSLSRLSGGFCRLSAPRTAAAISGEGAVEKMKPRP